MQCNLLWQTLVISRVVKTGQIETKEEGGQKRNRCNAYISVQVCPPIHLVALALISCSLFSVFRVAL